VIGWLDCAAGASGDMLLGALVDAGVPLAVLQQAVDAIGVEPTALRVSTVERHGIGATKVDVDVPDEAHGRTWRDVRALLEAAELADGVRATALDAFGRLARAEAAVHRTSPEDVHFHEVGALDAIADVVGAAAGFHALGLAGLTASPVSLGAGGTARAGHGVVPVPAPAVLGILAEAGAPVQSGKVEAEMCTPTGAALLAAAVTGWGPLPPMTPARTGHGAGGRDPAELPNILRLVLGEPAPEDGPAPTTDGGPAGPAADGGSPVPGGPAADGGPAPGGSAADRGGPLLLETNVDDLDPRLWPDVLERLLAAGASDAWLSPILMKKGRPAHTLHVLCTAGRAAAVKAEVFRRTSSIGLREVAIGKTALEREYGAVEVAGHRIGTKTARLDGEVVNVSVEFEDVRRAAEALGLPIKEVLRAATAASDRL
jgi:pyridinium-3,5-bisthiocarboxylic acid mononucleotide nickel chelatase